MPDDKREIQHVDAVLKMLFVMTKDNRYRSVLYEEDGSKAEVKTMCEVAERLTNKGKSEGRQAELFRMIEIKLAARKSSEQIADELELTLEETEALIQMFYNRSC